MRKYPRIEIDQRAYDGLSIEAVLRHKSIREIANEAILGHISKEALSVIDHKTVLPEDIATDRPLDHKTIEGTANNNNKPNLELTPDEKNVLDYLQAEDTYREVAAKTGMSKSKVQVIASKLEGMGLFQRKKK